MFFRILLLLVAGMWTYAYATDSPSRAENTMVTLDRSLHFFDPAGELVVVDPGSYVVEQAESWLRLITDEPKDTILIEAASTEHGETVDSPMAVFMESEDETVHLLLLMPDGKGWEAVGSFSGVQTRGLMQAKLSQAEIKQAFTAKTLSAARPFQSPSSPKPGLSVRPEATGGPSLQIQGSPPVPVLDQPAPNFSLTDSQISFRWHPSASNPNQTRYELCVAETGAACGSSAQSIVFRTIEAASQAGTAQYELGIGPTAGQQTPTIGTPITGSTYTVKLPIRFQGKRLQWSVKACAPNPNKSVIGGKTAESCSQSGPRILLWPLSQPVLKTPSNGPLHNLKPTFSWNYGDTHGLDHFLLCIAKPGVSCGQQPSSRPHVLVIKIRGTTQYTFPLGSTPSMPPDLSPFMGQTLHWSVAACNTVFGCRYQEHYGILHVTPPAGTFAPLYPVTQHSKCTNCHGMAGHNAKFHQHVQEGRFPAETDFPYFSPQPICLNCHTKDRGFENGWRAPRSNLDFTGDSLPQVCRQVKYDGAAGYFLTDFEPAREHLKMDKLILWAVQRIPGMNEAKWHSLVDAWIDARAPCPCDPGDCGFGEHPYGQFTR